MARFNPTTISPILVGVWAVLGGISSGIESPFLRSLELQTQALFFHLRGPVPPPTNMVIVAIDDDSLARGRDAREIQELAPIASWPWRRTAYATVIDRVMAAGARAVAVDIVFDLPSEYPADDRQLQQTLQRHAGRVVLATLHASSQATGGGLDQLVFPDPMFQTQPPAVGLINYLPEANGQFHRFTDVYIDRIDPELRQTQPGLISFDRAVLQAARLPLLPARGTYISFYGGWQTFPTISFWNLLDQRNWALLRQQQVFKDKLVLIGPTAGVLQDLHNTPFGEMAGIEIHANAIATLMQGGAIADPLPQTPWRGGIVFSGIAAVGLFLHFLSRRPTVRSLTGIGIAIAWGVIGYLCFAYGRLIVPVAIPAGSIAMVGLSYLATGAVGDRMEKLRLRRTLERYVATPIVQEVLSQPENFQSLLEGRNIQVVVLFCDIRGFTTLSYKLPAKQLVAQLNTYLNAMVEAIITHRGTLDKFIGDAVMAEFGSPVSQGHKTDAMNAMRAALEMRRSLAQLRQQWAEEGKIPFYNGIGISYGEVIAGNIGSLKRLEYTVIGDAVNVASRVEGLTKTFQTDLLITAPLYELIQDEVEAVDLGKHSLRGREESPTHLYSVICLKGENPELYHQVHAELQQYLGKARKH